MKQKNREEKNQYMKDYYKNNPEQRKKFLERTKKWRKENPGKLKIQRDKYNEKAKDLKSLWAFNKARRNKIKIINAYGGVCSCCGEDTIEFLSIDHINNDGAKHRKELKILKTTFYQWIINNNYPKGFQVLCMNCNTAKGYYGQCPHQIAKDVEGY
jgi:esterase/lipase